MTERTLINRRSLNSIIEEGLEERKNISLNALIEKSHEDAKIDTSYVDPHDEDIFPVSGTPIFNLPSKRDLPEGTWGTSLEVTEDQITAFKAARNEVDKRRAQVEEMDRVYPEMGLLAQYDEYIKAEGRVGFLGTLDRRMSNVVGILSNLLQAPSYGVGAAIEDALIEDSKLSSTGIEGPVRSGSAVWEGWKAFASEIGAGYTLGLNLRSRQTDISELAQRYGLLDIDPRKVTSKEKAEARRLGISPEILEEYEGDLAEASEAANWTLALMGTIFIDPLNYIPGTAFATVPRKIYRAAEGTRAGKPITDALDKAFKMHPELPAEHRKALLNIKRRFGAKAENEIVAMLDEIDSMITWMSPRERRLMGTLMDQPKLMEKQIDAFIEGGLIIAENGPKLKEYAKVIRNFTKRLFASEVNAPIGGVIDPSMFRDLYLHGTTPKDPRLAKAFERVAESRRPEQIRSGGGLLPGTEAMPGFGQEKSYPNQLDRVLAGIRGDVEYGTELDIGNILRTRAVDSVRYVVSRQFGEAILTNPELATRIDFDPAFFNAKRPPIEGSTWKDIKETIETPLGKEGPSGTGQGMKVYEIKKKIKISDDFEQGAKYKEEIIGAYILPNEIYNFLTRSEELIGDSRQITAFGKAFDDLTNVWKGWATFGTGYHARNLISIMNSNWMAGVGRNKKGRFSLSEFMLRNLQAVKLMAVSEGAGRLPDWTLKRANSIARRYGWDSLDDVPDIGIKDADGRVLSYSEIARMGEDLGVPQVASSIYNTEAGAADILWNSDVVGMPTEISQKIDPRVAEVMAFGSEEGLPLKDKLSKIGGAQFWPIKVNRAAAQIVENQGRWTLFLDSLAKGMPAEAAAEMPRLWHFDYRMLTDFEKTTFKRILPFYAWQRFAAPRVMMAILENPGRMAQIPKTKDAVESLYPEFEQAETPDYWDEVMAWQVPYINQDNMPVAGQIDIPLLELNRFNVKDILSSTNPIISGPLQLFLNQDFFMGSTAIGRWEGQMPTRYEGEDPSSLFPWLPEEFQPSKRTEWAFGKAFPPFGKLTRLLEAQAKGETATLYQVGSELAGFKLRMLDERRIFRGQTYKKRKFGREFMKMLEERARTDEKLAKFFPRKPKYTAPAELFAPTISPEQRKQGR